MLIVKFNGRDCRVSKKNYYLCAYKNINIKLSDEYRKKEH